MVHSTTVHIHLTIQVFSTVLACKCLKGGVYSYLNDEVLEWTTILKHFKA